MSENPSRLLPADENGKAVALLREELARRRMSRQRLADDARISVSTLEKTLSGRRAFTYATIIRIETALGVALRTASGTRVSPATEQQAAPADLGGYARTGVRWLEGDYLTLRPSFSDSRAVYAYLTRIAWDATSACLGFSEMQRVDHEFAQCGRVSVPHQSGHIYLVTNDQGQFRLVTLARPTINKIMYGILSTLEVGSGSQLTPLAVPMALVPTVTVANMEFGKIDSGHSRHADYRRVLDRAIDDAFVKFPVR